MRGRELVLKVRWERWEMNTEVIQKGAERDQQNPKHKRPTGWLKREQPEGERQYFYSKGCRKK